MCVDDKLKLHTLAKTFKTFDRSTLNLIWRLNFVYVGNLVYFIYHYLQNGNFTNSYLFKPFCQTDFVRRRSKNSQSD